MPGYVDVQKAFQDAFTAQIQGKTYDAGTRRRGDQGRHRRRPWQPVAQARTGARGRPTRPVAHPGGTTGRRACRACAESTSAAVGGARRLRVDRRADGAVPGPPHRLRLLRAVHQPLGLERPLRARSTSWASPTTQALLADPIFHRAIQNSLYYALVWVPLTMAIGLFLAIIVNQKIRGQTFFRARLLLPGDRQLGGDHDPVDLHRLAVRPVQQRPRGAGAQPAVRAVRASTPNQNWIGDQDTALNSVIILNAWTTSGHVHALLPRLAAVDQRPGLRGGRDRRRERLADVLAHHLPAAPAGPLLRGDGRGHRRAPAVRPGGHRRRPERRPEQRADDRRCCTSTTPRSRSSTSATRRPSASSCSRHLRRDRSSSGGCSGRHRRGERGPAGRGALPTAARPSRRDGPGAASAGRAARDWPRRHRLRRS